MVNPNWIKGIDAKMAAYHGRINAVEERCKLLDTLLHEIRTLTLLTHKGIAEINSVESELTDNAKKQVAQLTEIEGLAQSSLEIAEEIYDKGDNQNGIDEVPQD